MTTISRVRRETNIEIIATGSDARKTAMELWRTIHEENRKRRAAGAEPVGYIIVANENKEAAADELRRARERSETVTADDVDIVET